MQCATEERPEVARGLGKWGGGLDMTETLFEFDKHNYLRCQDGYRGSHNEEYYLGDYSIEPASVIEVRAERRAVGAYSIIRVRSRTRMTFRRSWSHIRQDGIDVAVLWFVKRGTLTIDQHMDRCTAHAGDFAATTSATPLFTECLTDDDSMYETLQVVVPAYVLRRLFPSDWNSAFHLSLHGQVFAIAERMLKDIFDDTGELSDKVAATVVESALLVLSDAIKSRRMRPEPRQRQADTRIKEALKFIDVHLTNSELSIAMVARACGISERYLFSLLREHGTPFRELVWDRRLKAAKQWLSSTKATETMVSEVAYRSGFKSPAHFSRAFKRAFAMNPCECRVPEGPARTHARDAQFFTVPRGLS